MKEIYNQHKLLFWSVAGILLVAITVGVALSLWDMVLALFGFGIGVPVMIQRHATIEEREAQAIKKVEEDTEQRLQALYSEVERKPNNIPPQTSEERKKALLKGLDNV